MAANRNFIISNSATIDLSSGDITTELLLIGRTDSFVISAINFTGDGAPTWSLQVANVDDINEVAYYTPDSNDKDITDKIINRSIAGFNYFAIEIKMNDNTTGTVEFIYTSAI